MKKLTLLVLLIIIGLQSFGETYDFLVYHSFMYETPIHHKDNWDFKYKLNGISKAGGSIVVNEDSLSVYFFGQTQWHSIDAEKKVESYTDKKGRKVEIITYSGTFNRSHCDYELEIEKVNNEVYNITIKADKIRDVAVGHELFPYKYCYMFYQNLM